MAPIHPQHEHYAVHTAQIGITLDALPKLQGDIQQQIATLVDKVDYHVQRIVWSDARILTEFGRRSAEDILMEGDTCYMGPCLDFSLVAYQFLARNELSPSLVVDEVLIPDKFRPEVQTPAIHFALQFRERGHLYWLDFAKDNQVYWGSGDYASVCAAERTQRKEISQSIHPGHNLMDILGIKSAEGLAQHFKRYSFEQQLALLLQSNTMANARRYGESLGSRKNLQLTRA